MSTFQNRLVHFPVPPPSHLEVEGVWKGGDVEGRMTKENLHQRYVETIWDLRRNRHASRQHLAGAPDQRIAADFRSTKKCGLCLFSLSVGGHVPAFVAEDKSKAHSRDVCNVPSYGLLKRIQFD